MNTIPTREQFFELAKQGNLISVSTIVSMDAVTPITAYSNLRLKGGYSFLLESAERTGQIGRYSFVGRSPYAIFRSNGRTITITENGRTRTFQTERTPLDELKAFMAQFNYVSVPGLPEFSGGAVGYMGYDVVRFFEPTMLEAAEKDELNIPEMIYMIAKEVIVFDHLTRRLHIIYNSCIRNGNAEEAYANAYEKIDQTRFFLGAPTYLPMIDLASNAPEIQINSNTTKERFCEMVARVKEFINAGDIFQVVLSQRLSTPYTRDPLELYRSLWMENPSPYMFCIEFGNELSLVGSSPEVNVKAINGRVNIRPIAGTRGRGRTPEEDLNLERELLADPKERAEHVMLVDLARNDIGRIAEFGSVKVTQMFEIERFSRVMHIVSNVVAKLRPEFDAYDVMRLSFPAGTVSGAPKIRAMQIIRDFEGNKRGAYSGAVGYFGFDGNMDSCIALRTVVLKNGTAYVQAGAGIVADSVPENEYEECIKKARAMILAIARTQLMEV